MTTRNSPPAGVAELKLTITRVISAPCAMVFRAWTDPQQMVQWFSPENVECRSVSADLKIGGAYRIHMVSGQGDHIAFGKYLEIVPNKRLQFTWEREDHDGSFISTVTVEFEELGKTTRLTLIHAGFPTRAAADDHTDGWTTAIEKFARMMAQGEIKA
jgi:uncharacterized protein YndB with AHSA1/START domain